MASEEKKRERIGLIVSLTVHGIILALLFFLIAWREPDPPIPEYGIELNFGLDQAGSGEVQPETPAPVEELEEPQESAAAEETQPEPMEEPVETEPIKETTPPAQQTYDVPSPDVVEKPAEKPEPKKEEPKPEPKPEVKNEALYPGSARSGEKGDDAATTGASQGDKANASGDQGDPEGSLDAKALYGTSGGGGGASLNMAGWNWDFVPKPNDTSAETGRIKYRITINDRGEVISIVPLERTVSSTVEKIYRAEVEKLTFSPTSQGATPPPRSTGTITFVIKAR